MASLTSSTATKVNSSAPGSTLALAAQYADSVFWSNATQPGKGDLFDLSSASAPRNELTLFLNSGLLAIVGNIDNA